MLSSLILVFSALCVLPFTISKGDDKPLEPCRGRQICTTLMKYKDDTVTDEGDYCECTDNTFCSKEWSGPSDNSSLTWQHYERAHWTVQYKLCHNLFGSSKVCEGSELGAQVKTAVAEWAPDLTLPRCKCPDDGIYRLTGWERNGDIWEYSYTCKREECPPPSQNKNKADDKVECARIYVNPRKKTDKVLEMKFHCSCPEGYLCPAKYNEKEDDSRLESDEDQRSFVAKNCEPVVKKKNS